MVEGTLATALARAGMAHRARAQSLLAEVGLHPGQEFLLAHLWEHGPRPVGVIAEALGVEPPTVTRMVGRMERAGLLERRPDPEDGRRVLVTTTPAADDLRAGVQDAWDRLDAETAASLTDAEAATLHELLVRVASSLRAERGAC